MCYGMGCPYEDHNGECRLYGKNIPEDAACRSDEEYEDDEDDECDTIHEPDNPDYE